MRLGLLVLALAFLAVGCGSETAPGEKGANALEITRADGTRVEFADRLQAWCGWYGDIWGEPVTERPRALQIVGGELLAQDSSRSTAFWMFARSVDDLGRTRALQLPDQERGYGQATLYVSDPKTESGFSSYEATSFGQVVVAEWGCDQGDRVRISIDAELDSESHPDSASLTKVRGEIEAVIGERAQVPD